MADKGSMRWFLLTSAAALLVTMAGEMDAQTTPTVTGSPSSLAFAWQTGAKLPAAQTVSVRITTGTPAYTVTTPAQDQWLIATPFSGALPASLAVQVNPSTLSPGLYLSSVTVTV